MAKENYELDIDWFLFNAKKQGITVSEEEQEDFAERVAIYVCAGMEENEARELAFEQVLR
jgi:hypothetical protein